MSLMVTYTYSGCIWHLLSFEEQLSEKDKVVCRIGLSSHNKSSPVRRSVKSISKFRAKTVIIETIVLAFC